MKSDETNATAVVAMPTKKRCTKSPRSYLSIAMFISDRKFLV